MAKRKKTDKRKIDWLNHSVGFVSVVIGVIIAFWLNSWAIENKERKIAKVALQNIRSEIVKNSLSLDTLIDLNRRQLLGLETYVPKLDKDMWFVGSSAEFDSLRMRFPDLIISRGRLNIGIELYSLPDVAWKTSLNSSVLSSTDFELVYMLNEAYSLQEKISNQETMLLANLRNIGLGEKNSFIDFQRALGTYIQLAEQLNSQNYLKCIAEIDRFMGTE